MHRLFALSLLVGIAAVAPAAADGVAGVALTALGLWNVGGLLGVTVVLGVLVGCAARSTTPARAGRWLALVVAAALVTYPLVATGPGIPWVAHLLPVAAVACGLSWPPAPAGLAVTGLMLAQGYAQWASTWETSATAALLDALVTASIASAVILPATAIRSWAGKVHAARDAAHAAAARSEITRAGEAESTWWDGTIHDDILALLTEAGRATRAADLELLAPRAQRVAERLAARTGHERRAVGDLTEELTHAIRSICPTTTFDVTLTAEAAPVRADVAEAVVSAASEAARNAVRHAWPAGWAGARELLVTVQGTSDGLAVTLSDNGVGFTRVPPGRLGLTVSVVERVKAVGGTASWSSTPGAGTTVALWCPDGGGRQ